METCKSCQWHENSDPKGVSKWDRNGGDCSCPKFHEGSYSGGYEETDTLVYSFDDDPGDNFWTGDNFGCVHHKVIIPQDMSKEG